MALVYESMGSSMSEGSGRWWHGGGGHGGYMNSGTSRGKQADDTHDAANDLERGRLVENK